MTPHSTRRHQALLKKSTALAIAAPQVVAHRTLRMAQAGPVLSARDQREFQGMVFEKGAAFFESWAAMWAEWVRLGMSFMLGGLTGGPYTASRLSSFMSGAAVSLAGKGLAPVHKRATANSRRLGATLRQRGGR